MNTKAPQHHGFMGDPTGLYGAGGASAGLKVAEALK
jgi:hypothetical protein